MLAPVTLLSGFYTGINEMGSWARLMQEIFSTQSGYWCKKLKHIRQICWGISLDMCSVGTRSYNRCESLSITQIIIYPRISMSYFLTCSLELTRGYSLRSSHHGLWMKNCCHNTTAAIYVLWQKQFTAMIAEVLRWNKWNPSSLYCSYNNTQNK